MSKVEDMKFKNKFDKYLTRTDKIEMQFNRNPTIRSVGQNPKKKK